jgi:predicted MFS family arabinose efflux permease
VLGGFLTHALGWRSIFIFATVCEAVLFVIALAVVPKPDKPASSPSSQAAQHQGASRFDPLGCVLLVATIVLLMAGLSTFTQFLASKVLVVLAIIIFVVFVFVELHSPSPVIQVRFFAHNKNYTCSNFAALLNYSATFGLTYLMSTYLQVVDGFNAGIAGLILICQPIVMTVVSPFMGRLSDKRSPYALATTGMAICALAILLFCFIGVATPLPVIIAGLLLMGLGVATFSSPNNNAVMSCVGPKDHGVASSLLNTMRTVGQSTSLAVITLVSSLTLGTQSFSSAAPAQLVSATRICFIVFIVFSAAAIFLSLQRRSKK